MKTTLRITLTMLLCLIVCLCIAPIAFAETIVDSGTCGAQGDNLTWTLYDNGKLVIEGTGAMADYEWTIMPWYKYYLSITSVVLKTGVTSIGDSAFEDCTNMTSVSIPDTITRIGNDSFRGCSRLESLSIPEGIIQIGGDVFMGCSSLTSVTIPASIVVIGGFPFAGCTNLNAITVDPKNPVFCDDDGILFTKDMKTLYQYPAGKNDLLYRFPESVTRIMNGAFYGCGRLTSITIPEKMTRIEMSTFFNCSGLTSITIPYSVTSIDEGAFWNCNNLTDVFYDGTEEAWQSIMIEGDNKSLTEASIHYSGVIHDNTYSGTWGSLEWTLDKNGILTISGTGGMDDFTFSYSSEEAWRSRITSIKNVIINTGVSSIGNRAFQNCTNMMSVSIPDTVETIGGLSFRNCSSLRSLVIPEGVTSISGDAFFECSNLTSVMLPASLTSMGGGAFANCAMLNAISVDPDNPSYCDVDGVVFSKNMEILWQYPAGMNGNYRIPDSVTHIFNGAFFGCSGMTNIFISDNVASIGDYAFLFCSSLSDVFYGGTKEQWKQIAIGNNNDSLASATIHYLTIPDFILPVDLTSIEEEAFTGDAFVYPKLSENTVSIGRGAFADCPNLIYIYIPEATTSIDPNAFDNVTGLTIFGKAGSTAETFAQMHGFSFVAVS